MNKPSYYGEYSSSTLSQTGCVKRFATTVSDSLLFPAQVSYVCSLCENKEHRFGLVRTWSVGTKSQLAAFQQYCESHTMDTEVDVS